MSSGRYADGDQRGELVFSFSENDIALRGQLTLTFVV